jgi:Fe-S cluster assembly protein SufD
MDTATADAALARRRIATQPWIPRKAPSFRHLPPPPAQVWMPSEEAAPFDVDAAPTDGWTVTQQTGAGPSNVEVRWLDAGDLGQRAELLAGLVIPDGDEAAPFARAHRALVRRGLRLRIAPAPQGGVTWLRIVRRACAAVEAPLLRIELLAGARCVLLETHESDPRRALVQNLHIDVRLDAGAELRHVRQVAPAADDRVSHHVQARLAADANYAQALLASGSGYHLQRNVFELQGVGSAAACGSVLLASGSTLAQQVLARHAAPATRSAVEVLALAGGTARIVADASTRMEAGCGEAETRQRLTAIPTGGQPRIVLRPHLEIRHDQVHAAHGATWGALPEEALFHARQRGLCESAAKALIVGGLARAVLARAVDDAQWDEPFRCDGVLEAAVARHLAAAEVVHG